MEVSRLHRNELVSGGAQAAGAGLVSLQRYISGANPAGLQLDERDPHVLGEIVAFDTAVAESDRHRRNVLVDPRDELWLPDNACCCGYWTFDSFTHKSLAYWPLTASPPFKAGLASVTQSELIELLDRFEDPKVRASKMENRIEGVLAGLEKR